ncbi:hypothetical protein GCM10023084_41700 [Streptomyces lacrimifluminis]|uniref:Uncharacterized protein n=1 Tax=Streptomyces lacrimifluminis TaxID=1500077 RepID=A0A917NYW8_9ACTN|nr:hypothetical protein GCM10012282_43330 [Streptomyces lacrimifluminis]
MNQDANRKKGQRGRPAVSHDAGLYSDDPLVGMATLAADLKAPGAVWPGTTHRTTVRHPTPRIVAPR